MSYLQVLRDDESGIFTYNKPTCSRMKSLVSRRRSQPSGIENPLDLSKGLSVPLDDGFLHVYLVYMSQRVLPVGSIVKSQPFEEGFYK